MKNSIATMRALFCLIAAMLLLVGCDEPDKTAAQPQTVRMKITAKAETGPPAATAVAAPPAQPAPAAAAGEKPVLAQVATPETPPSVPVPPPKPKEPPPTQSAESPPATTSGMEAGRPLTQTTVGSFPKTDIKPLDAGEKPVGGDAAELTSQLATLLKIQVPPPYDHKGKPDPFEPYVKLEGAQVLKTLQPKRRVPQTPLEQMELGQLKLVAIIAGGNSRWALVEESTGKGYTLREGTYIGTNSGKVADIKPDKIIIEEEYLTEEGKTVIQKKEMTLPKPPGEM